MLVGFLMMQQVKGIDWDDLEVAIPAFLTIVLMPFTYSISVGIGAGFLAYVIIKTVRGKAAEVHPLMWLVAVLFIVYFAHPPRLTDLAHLSAAEPRPATQCPATETNQSLDAPSFWRVSAPTRGWLRCPTRFS